MIALLFALFAIYKVLYQAYLYPRFLTRLKHIKAPGGRSWWRGNTNSIFVEAPYQRIREWIKDFPDEDLICYYVVGNLERLIPTSREALREILATKAYDFEKPRTLRQGLRRIVGDGILLAEGQEHKDQRNNLQPAFDYAHIKDLYPIFWNKSSEMVKSIQKALAGQEAGKNNTVQIRTWASRATLDIIGLAGMDQDFGSLRGPEKSPLALAYKKLLAPPDNYAKLLFIVGIFMGILPFTQKIPTKRNKMITEGGNAIRDTARQMIREKKAKMKCQTVDTHVDIISVALKKGTIDDDNLVEQLMTFLGAGHETTATALQWAIYELCKNPIIQARLREEVRARLPSISVDNPKPLSADTLDRLPYLNAVCNEILRFHPPVPTTVRVANKDTTVLDKPIPKGTYFIISPEIINHMKSLWGEDPEKFDPERFLKLGRANSGGAKSNYSNLTFLGGPHRCIGEGFARAELACLLAAIVGSFEFELESPEKPLELRETVTVSPKDGVLAKFTPLEGW